MCPIKFYLTLLEATAVVNLIVIVILVVIVIVLVGVVVVVVDVAIVFLTFFQCCQAQLVSTYYLAPTLAPALNSLQANALPRPWADPVIIATLP